MSYNGHSAQGLLHRTRRGPAYPNRILVALAAWWTMDLKAHTAFFKVEEIMPNKKSAKRKASDAKKKAAKKQS